MCLTGARKSQAVPSLNCGGFTEVKRGKSSVKQTCTDNKCAVGFDSPSTHKVSNSSYIHDRSTARPSLRVIKAPQSPITRIVLFSRFHSSPPVILEFHEFHCLNHGPWFTVDIARPLVGTSGGNALGLPAEAAHSQRA